MNKSMDNNYTLLNFSKTDKVILWFGFPLVGLVLGWFLPSIAKWASTLPWVPFQGPLNLIASYNGAWVSFITMVLGLLVGIMVTLFSFHESLEMTIYDEEVMLKLRDDETILKKEDISLVFIDGKQIVLLGNDEKELFRYKQELNRNTVGTAFLKHNYLWSEKAPFKEDYKKWVVDCPDLSPAANALFKARKVAIEDGNDEEVFQLAKELWKLRVSVKEKGKSQYYR
ncbi:YqeB family protein [Lysinibacillus xylanilyticus]|uniref:YqeB family protein n=1 Tax=Lysinibacillus xylanilyticus TaxID=582475 RepID=UPI0038025AF4